MFVMEALWGRLPFNLVVFLLKFLPTRRFDRVRNYMKVARGVAKNIVTTQTKEYAAGKEGAKDIMSILSTYFKNLYSKFMTYINCTSPSEYV